MLEQNLKELGVDLSTFSRNLDSVCPYKPGTLIDVILRNTKTSSDWKGVAKSANEFDADHTLVMGTPSGLTVNDWSIRNMAGDILYHRKSEDSEQECTNEHE